MAAIYPLPDSVLFEISPRLKANGKLSVVGHLHDLIKDVPDSQYREQKSRALMLAAVNYQVASRILDDLGIRAQYPEPIRWVRQMAPRSVRVPAHALLWASVSPATIRPLPLTQSYLNDLPIELVTSTLEWAPPVVTPADRNGRHTVVANHITALLANQLMANQDISTRILTRTTSLKRDISEICGGIVKVMKPLYVANRKRIAAYAGRLPDAPPLSGYGRAWSSEIIRRSK